MNDGHIIAGASEAYDSPVIIVTEPAQDISTTGQDYFDDEALDLNSPQEAESVEDVYRDFTDRYSAAPVSQADFFAPADLRSSQDATRPMLNLIHDEDVAFDPRVPRIVIIGPEAGDVLLPPKESPVLSKAVPLDRKARFLDETGLQIHPRPGLRERRHSISMVPERRREEKSAATQISSASVQATPTPQPWVATDTEPKGGWKMRSRCSDVATTGATVDVVMVYLYNSSLCDKTRHCNVDLDIFRHHSRSDATKADPIPIGILQRARTDLEEQSRRILPSVFAPAPNRFNRGQLTDSQKHHTRLVDWLQDHDMLRKQIPGSRVITVGFDVFPVLSVIPNFETAAMQLIEYLRDLRKQQETPIIFLGHALGGVIVIQALALASLKASFAEGILSCTAGAFLFSCSFAYTDERARNLAGLYGAKSSDRIFNDLSGSPAMERLSKMAKTKLYSPHPRGRSASQGPPRKQVLPNAKRIAIGFPITQFFAQGDSQSPGADSLSAFFSTPIRTVAMGKDVLNAMRFSNSQDADFLRIVLLLRSALQSCQLLHATAAGNVREVDVLIREGINPNLRDRFQTALQIAVRLNHEDIVHTLVHADGIEINVRDNKSNTPLHHAVRNGNETIIRALLHHDADINLQNSGKLTPRDLAEKHKSRMHIAKMLRSRLVSGPDQSLCAKRVGTGGLPASKEGQLACKNFQITITEIYTSKSSDEHWSVNVSVEALLYGSATLSGILQQVRPKAVNAKSPVCVWIHVPENNMIWVEDLFAKLNLHPAIWQETKRSITDSLRNRAITPHIGENDLFSIFLPYLSYEANFRQTKRTEYIQVINEEHQREESANANIPQEITRTIPQRNAREFAGDDYRLLKIPDAADLETYPYRDEDSDSDFSDDLDTGGPDDLEDEEKALIRCYLHSPPALHVRRTLDQYYYHMLESTKERDIDQVVSRWSQTVRSEARHNILMVDQLWLWTGRQKPSTPGDAVAKANSSKQAGKGSLGSNPNEEDADCYVISCFPSRTGTGHLFHQFLDDLRLLVLDPNRRKRDPIRQPEDLISRIMETCCSVFDRLQDTESLRFFQMFEDSIGSIDDKESRLFRDFQRGSTRLLELSPINKYYNNKKNALLIELLDIREEIKLLVEVKDIRDEINIILSVLGIQRTLLEQMSSLVANESTFVQSPAAENLVKLDITDFTKLDSQTRTIQDKLNTLMDLKQKAANAWEAREARETTVAASKQGNTVLVFTVVTIIFLPLSFMSSFFAIGIAAFPKDASSGATSWPLGIVTGLLFGISLSVSIPLIVFALNMEYCSAIYRELRHNYLAHTGIRLIELLPTLTTEDISTSKRKQWTERLRKCYEDYVKDDEADAFPNEVEVLQKFDNDTKPSISFPSTASSHTLIGADHEQLLSPPSRGRLRRFGIRKKNLDSHSSIGRM